MKTIYHKAGYARHKKTGVKGDISSLDSLHVSGIVHGDEGPRPFSWKLGRKQIELIEFGSFNPRNKNYVPGGKILATL